MYYDSSYQSNLNQNNLYDNIQADTILADNINGTNIDSLILDVNTSKNKINSINAVSPVLFNSNLMRISLDESKFSYTGPQGSTGPTGPQGVSGLQGSTGIQGPTGFISISGTNYSDYVYWDVVNNKWNTDSTKIHIGADAGRYAQLADTCAIGKFSGFTNQQTAAMAIGYAAGFKNQSSQSTAIGYMAGYDTQYNRATAVGYMAGYSGQGTQGVAIGFQAGQYNQAINSVSIGSYCGITNSSYNGVGVGNDCAHFCNGYAVSIGQNANYRGGGGYNIAIGMAAGFNTQSYYSLAIGYESGRNNQGTNAIAIGNNAGRTLQGQNTIAIGLNAGQTNQGLNSIAIGNSAGLGNQGANSIAIGNGAGQANQVSQSIIINAATTGLNNVSNAGLYIQPVRNDNTPMNNVIQYNTSTKELTYNSLFSYTGPTGAQGNTGPQGIQGLQGNTGPSGIVSLTGSTNQISVSNPSSGTYVLSTPQNIDTNCNFQGSSISIINSSNPVLYQSSTSLSYAGEQQFKNSSGNGFTIFAQPTSLDFNIGKLVSNSWSSNCLNINYTTGITTFYNGYINKNGSTTNDTYEQKTFTLNYPNSNSFKYKYTKNGNVVTITPPSSFQFYAFGSMDTTSFLSTSYMSSTLAPLVPLEFPITSDFGGTKVLSKIRLNTDGSIQIFYNWNETAYSSFSVGMLVVFSKTALTYNIA